MSLLVEVPAGREPEREYVVDVVLGHYLGLTYRLTPTAGSDVRITLDGDARTELTIADRLLSCPVDDWIAPASLPVLPLVHAGVLEDVPALPVLYGERRGHPEWVVSTEHGLETAIDVFGAVFFLLTRYEELVARQRDRHDRFPASASVLHRAGLLTRPLVDEYVDFLWSLLQRLWTGLVRRRQDYQVTLTHDVDWPLVTQARRWWQVARGATGDIVTRRDPGLALRRLRAGIEMRSGRPDRDPGNTFDLLLDENERCGLVGRFFFIAGHTAGETDGVYQIDDPWILTLMRTIHARGHEIGLHPSYGTYRDPDATRTEFDRLRAAADRAGVIQSRWGGRQHFLRWSNPETWQNWEDAGLDYDSTVGFAEQPGFRCGTCRPFPVFNLRTRRRLRLQEEPLALMDATLLTYQRLGIEKSLGAADALIDTVRRHRGQLVILWHNTYLMSASHRTLYRLLLERVTAP